MQFGQNRYVPTVAGEFVFNIGELRFDKGGNEIRLQKNSGFSIANPGRIWSIGALAAIASGLIIAGIFALQNLRTH